jgi:hypothetical protein
MNWDFIKTLLSEDDEKLTENGLQLKRLAERMQKDGYKTTEEDKDILDQKWRQIWKDN